MGQKEAPRPHIRLIQPGEMRAGQAGWVPMSRTEAIFGAHTPADHTPARRAAVEVRHAEDGRAQGGMDAWGEGAATLPRSLEVAAMDTLPSRNSGLSGRGTARWVCRCFPSFLTDRPPDMPSFLPRPI